MRYDVIVAGAGPAGSTVARECASRGLSVLALDRAEFPRDKPCGGGVTVRAARMLPFEVSPVVERSITGVYLSVKQNRSYQRAGARTLAYLTQRCRLDAYLLERAVAAGAEIRERLPVRAVERENGRVLVRAGGEVFEGSVLVAADGANGPTAKLAGVDTPRIRGIALEGNISLPKFPERWTSTMAIDVGATPGGYGWLFPKADHVNVGVGGWYHIGPSLRPRLNQLTRFYGFDPGDLRGIRGHPLPVRRPCAPLTGGNVLLAGDAAGLIDPLTGEGIYSAVRSGVAAAEAISEYLAGRERSLDGYVRDIESVMGEELRVATQLHILFQAWPPAWAGLIEHSSTAWQLVCALLSGDVSYRRIREKSPLLQRCVDSAVWLVAAAAGRRRDRRIAELLQAAISPQDPLES